ncbi:MAG: IS200/IS605 family transposase [Candidatus Omnitrophota bacterium]
MEVRVSGHSVYRTQYHIVWVTKYRRRILNPGVRSYLLKLFPKIMRSLPGCEVREYSIRDDHVHLIMLIPPRYSVSEVVGRMKSRTAGILRRRFSWLKRVYHEEGIVWSSGFFVSTVGLDEKEALEYVKWQGRQDSGQAQLEFL